MGLPLTSRLVASVVRAFAPEGSHPAAPGGDLTPEIEAALREAVTAERRGAFAVASAVRAAGASAFLMLACGTWAVSGAEDWRVYLAPFAGYAAVSLAVFAARRSALLERAAWLPPLMDVATIYLLQRRSLPLSPFPAGVAGFSLGVFALLVSLSGLGLRGEIVVLTAAAGAAAQASLMRAAGVATGPILAAFLVLAAAALVAGASLRRLRALAAGLVRTELERAAELRRAHLDELARHEVERRLEEARTHNEDLSRLQHDREVLNQLLVHDLRGPLSAILGNVEWLSTELAALRAPQGTVEALRDIEESARRTNGMVADLIDTRRLEEESVELSTERVGAVEVVERMASFAKAVARGRRIAVESSADPGLQLVADRALLGRVLENLASNAVRHGRADGRVLFTAGRAPDGMCELGVHNDGTPIPVDERERLFEKYAASRAGPGRQGWGLGLYFCRLVVRAHGGTVEVVDVPGWNASFRVRVPAAPELPRPLPLGERPRVLVVDDERPNLDTVARAFRRELNVEVAGSGAEAMRLLGEQAFDVALVDYSMPEMNGVQFARRARAAFPGLKVILVTGHADLDDIREAHAEGVIAAALTKPWDRQALLEAVSREAPRRRP